MWERAGLVRIARELDQVGVPGGGSFNMAWQDWLNLKNQVTVAELIAASALERRESRGAHYRRDCPSPDPSPVFTVRVQQRNGAPAVWRAPVAFTRIAPPDRAPVAVPVDIGD